MDYEGFIFEVLKHISYKLNFTMTVVEPANTGPRDPATWGAMVDMVAANQVMVGAASFAVTSARREKVDFTEAVDLHPYGFMYKKPTSVSKELLLVNPFTLEVWLGVAVMVTIIGPIYYLVHRSSYYYTFTGENKDYGMFQLNRCIFYCFGAILQQGGDILPTADSGKVAIFIIHIIYLLSACLHLCVCRCS